MADALIADLPGAEEIYDRAAGENFSVASFLVGRAARRHLVAIYGYARLVDQIGDAAAGDRPALLDRFEADLDRIFAGTEPVHPVLRRLAPTVHELDLPRGPFARLIEANRRDQERVRYETYEELLGYCALSANPVGELVLHVFGAATDDRIALSDRICSALQLAEHWQDVAEDRAAGRIYLPAEDLARFEVAETDLDASTTGTNLRKLMGFEVARARELLDAGAPLVGRLGGRARIAVAGYVAGGRAALDAIDAARHDVLAGPPRASAARRVWPTLELLARGA
ncbi:MAG TPA: squalene synthase HpnC [Gaiellaceae bacterium]|jgi:squalene synthase HpnC|nr:squalene synthase HpnC [Gaiellaceae bacterium]